MVFYIRLYRGVLVDALVSSFLWMAFLNLTTSLPHRSCHSCLGQSATRDPLVWEINLPFVFLIIWKHTRGKRAFWAFVVTKPRGLWESTDNYWFAELLWRRMLWFLSLQALAPAQPIEPECRRSTLGTSPAKNKITSFPLSVGSLLSLMFGWSHSDALWSVRLF